MLKRFSTASIVCLVAALSFASVPKSWSARYDTLTKTLRSKDLRALKAFFHESFVSVDSKGVKTGRDAFFKELEGLFADATKVTAHEKLYSVKAQGPTTLVSFDLVVKIKKKSGTTTVHEVGVDYWKKFGKKWLMVKTVDSKFDVTESK